MIPTPSTQPPQSRIGIRFIGKGYSCVIIKDKHKTTCIYTAYATTRTQPTPRRAALPH